MKKFTAIMMALVMVLGLTQCRPDNSKENDTQNGSKVKVSCVVPMNKGAKSEFTNLMTDGTVKWSAGTERIYLAIPDETNPQIVEMTAFTTVESNILAFEGEVAEGLLKNGEYEVWYLGNSKNLDIPYITETKDGSVIKSISGSIASQSGNLEDLGYCHIAKTTVTAETKGDEVVLSMNGTLKNQIAIAHLNLEGITQLKGGAIIGTEYTLQYNNGTFEFVLTPNATANISVTEGTIASYVVLLPNAAANVDLKSNTSKKVTFEGGVEANKVYCKHVSDLEYYPLAWKDYEGINGYEYVDLGLPSGLLWATCNVGANTPEGYGDYFAWGEVETKDEYLESNCATSGYSNKYSSLQYRGYIDREGNLTPEYDAATANWGGDWRMPTQDEYEELMNEKYCTWTWTTQNGINGYKVASTTNSNYIFLPAAAQCGEKSLTLPEGYEGCYWISTIDEEGYSNVNFALRLNFRQEFYSKNFVYRSCGQSVRPVCGGNNVEPVLATISTNDITEITSNSALCGGNVTTDNGFIVTAKGVCWSTTTNPTISDNKTEDGNGTGNFTSTLSDLAPQTTYYVRAYATNEAGTSYGEEMSFTTLSAGPNANGHEYVDLGLPSGLLWATCNVGANTPEEYGDYFAWGETTTKAEYTEANSLTGYEHMNDISGEQRYDAATANWGGDWRMPTCDELSELITQCIWIKTTQNGVEGYKVTSQTNGNYIFMPAAGFLYGSLPYDAGYEVYYWSSTPYEYYTNDYIYHAYYLYSGNLGVYYDENRYMGCPVRPVIE